MKRKRNRRYNKLSLGKLSYMGNYAVDTVMRACQFSGQSYSDAVYTTATDIPLYLEENMKQWIEVHGLTDVEMILTLGKQFNIQQSDLQDVLTDCHITKTSVASKSLLFLVRNYYFDETQILQSEHIALLLYQNRVISFQESNRPTFDLVHKVLEENVNKVCERSIDYLCSMLLDTIINNCVDVIATIEQRLESMEENLISSTVSDNNIGVEVLAMRKNTQHLKRLLIPLKEQLPRLIHTEESILLRRENMIYWEDINDHLQLAVQLLESCREEVNAVFDLYVANNDLRMNEIMKRLTVVSTIFIPLTFMAGVWGMNYSSMPELSWKYGYAVAWLSFLSIGVLTWWYLRKRKWF